jgi:hypothetical protein
MNENKRVPAKNRIRNKCLENVSAEVSGSRKNFNYRRLLSAS